MDQLMLMPEKCVKCGELFDLNFDMEEDFGYKDEHFCWKCRKLERLADNMNGNEEDLIDSLELD